MKLTRAQVAALQATPFKIEGPGRPSPDFTRMTVNSLIDKQLISTKTLKNGTVNVGITSAGKKALAEATAAAA